MFNCAKCGSIISEDYSLSCVSYDCNIVEIINEDGSLNYTNFPNYLIFVCRNCGLTTEVKLQEIVDRLQATVIKQLLDTRLHVAFKTTDKTIINEANGVNYCGMCPGVIDDTGYCYNDVISQCVIRKVKLKNV